MTSSRDWPSDAKDPRRFQLSATEKPEEVDLVASTFPDGTTVTFEMGIMERCDRSCVNLVHLVFGEEFDPRVPHQMDGWIAILHYGGSYHLFSTQSHQYGGYIHDEAGISGWHIDLFTGAVYRMVGTFSQGRPPSRFEIKLGQWGQLEAMTQQLRPLEYLTKYVEHVRDTTGLPWPNGLVVQCAPELMQAVADGLTHALGAANEKEEPES